ncbi:MPND.2 family protein [Megaselia abdita]
MQEVKDSSPLAQEPAPAPEEQPPKEVEIEEEDQECFEGFNGSGRNVTLQSLLAANILHPEKASMTIEYLGQKFVGDLLPDGKIKSHETETIFLSPSSWAMHCKRIINPEKKSGCGWASVKYKGKKLDAYKAIWLKKCAQQKEEDVAAELPADLSAVVKVESPVPVKRITVAHNTISNRNIMHDANLLIEAVPFSSISKLQPFLLTISSNAMLVADLHCHLTFTEVCGYFGGSWDINTHTLTISKAYPGLNSKSDRHKAGGVEDEIKAQMQKDDLIVVGWYHCHPRFQAVPTLRDCDTQLDFQIRMRGPTEVTYTPIIGSIFSPYHMENKTLESESLAYWVTPPPESKQTMEYGRPMTMLFTISPEKDIPNSIKEDIQHTIQYYQDMKEEAVDFKSIYKDDITYLEKLKSSLYTKFPASLNDKEFWNWLCTTLNCEVDENDEFIPPKGLTKLTNPSKPPQETSETDKLSSSELKVLSLQEQLSLPSGMNMNPTRLCSPALATTSLPSTHSNANAVSVSPRDSPITIPSNSESPAKFEVPVRASPSPAKSDVSNLSNRTKNSPAPSPGKFSISEISRNSPSVTPHSTASHPSTSTPSLPPPVSNDIMTASLAQLAGQLPPSILQNSDFSTFFKQARKDYGNSSLNQLAAAAAKAGAGPSKQTAAQSQQEHNNTPSSSSSSHGHSSSSSKKQSQSTRNFMMSVNSYKTKLMKELDDIKNDPIKISELMRSPEYASLLLQQAEALGATTLGSFGLGPDFSFLAGVPNFNATKKQQANPTPPPNQMQQLQQEYAQLLQSSKLMGYDSYLQQAAKANPEVNAYIQQQIAAAASALGVTQKQPSQAAKNDYAQLFETYSKLFTQPNAFSGQKQNMVNSELSALLSAGMSSGGGSSNKKKSQDTSHHHYQQQQQQQHQLNQQNEMLNQLLQADKAQSELNAILCHQNKAANELNALFAQMPNPNQSSSNKGHSSSANAQAQAMADAAAYYNAISGGITQDKWQEYAKMFAQSTNAPNFGMPDPLSKSTLAANNFFMSPPQLAKFQQDSLNAMMMKPPKSTSSRIRESSASPAPERLTPTKPGRIDSPAAPKYNFSAADLAVSSVPSNTPSPAPSDGSASSSSRRHLNTPPVDLARLYPELQMSAAAMQMLQQQQPKKRMEFSSIADLAAPPPAKMAKTDDILNLSAND